ncbi:ferrous iron transport protein B [Faecalicatena contorta]|uniref:Ferrous iron transport protein B n=1 Tax=Faecalicatena contorta TaxID=39482 RepID=A0A316A0H9_9FIRM|nr:ferrous iron transport protein B [Faecalicatena contorta]PWJ51042.1 ferrous iron transport protein B [Faecalicatena contorta]SUQ13610.1 ferrous iron transport protein B [Faecalicatena contorta]
MSGNVIKVGFIGNPNCGKTTLFNAYTGANLKVANWPGVTVEKKEGKTFYKAQEFKLIDLPGIYSLTSYTMEEKVSRECIMSSEVDVIVNVVDASCLERNLYLTLQLIELGKPVVLALNMMDIIEERGMEIDLHRLPEMLGIPVIPVSARRRSGLEILMHAVAHHKDYATQSPFIHHHSQHTEHIHNHHGDYAVVYQDEIEDKIDQIIVQLEEKYPDVKNKRWHAIKMLEQDQAIMKRYPLNMPQVLDRSYEADIINQKYDFIEEVIQEILVNKNRKEESTDKIDKYLTGKWLGLPIFLGIMALVFFLTFTVGDWLKGYFEIGLEWFSGAAGSLLSSWDVAPMLQSLIVDGIISGVGGILTFLPNIFILFLALAFLEDSGYMSRVAFVMDDIMSRLGLSGRAFLPMLLGFGCTVPAIMASRALESRKDRLKTILVTPFMSCSARLPIYVLFSSMFFGKYAMLACYSMYLLGVIVAITTAFILSKIDGSKAEHALLIELPEYKTPNARTIIIYVWEKVKDYLTKAGTVIFIASIIMWFILNFGMNGYVTDISQSFGSVVGRAVVPVFEPLGLGYWQIIVALIAGIAAKEVVVSSCSVLFGIQNITTAAGSAGFAGTLAAMGFGMANAYSLMVFCLLYVPCTAAIATINREVGSKKITFGIVLFQLATAWVVSFLAYHIVGILF